MERIAPSARLEAQIAELLGDELAANGEKLAEPATRRVRTVLQRAVEDEVDRLCRSPRAIGHSIATTIRPPVGPKMTLVSVCNAQRGGTIPS